MVDSFARNNWIIMIVLGTAIVLITVSIFMFFGMINSVANNINLVVNNTSHNMTKLTNVLIEDQRRGSLELYKVVDNQTQAFIEAINEWAEQNNRNLDNISQLLYEQFNDTDDTTTNTTTTTTSDLNTNTNNNNNNNDIIDTNASIYLPSLVLTNKNNTVVD